MEIQILAGALVFLVLMVWLSKTLNSHSEMEYGYAPIGMATILLAMIPYVLIIAGIIFAKNGSDNLTFAIIFAVISSGGLFGWIAHRSSAMVGVGGTILLLLIGLPALILAVLASRDDGYYYD